MLRPNITPGGAALHVEADLAQDRLVVVLLDASGEEDHHPSRGAHDAAQPGGRGFLQRAVGLRATLVVLLGLVQLDDVGAQLLRHPRRVVLRVQRALSALGVDRAPARIGPHHERHAQPLAVLTYLLEIADTDVLARRADVERVAHRIGAQPHRVLDARALGRDRLAVVRDVRLSVELQDQRHAAAVLLHVLLGEPDPERDRGVLAFHGEAELEVGVEGRRVREEVGRAVLEALVEGQDEQGSVGRSVGVEQPPEPHPFSVRQGQAGQRTAGFESRRPVEWIDSFVSFR